MLIPVKCFTCGNVLANKYRFYIREVEKKKLDKSIDLDEVKYLDEHTNDKTPEGEVMDLLQLNRYCCRRHMLTHVDIE
tara:strand:- start:13415 stop:13648 length:234 start_codon:yes stop_codon:yes gene_type:complete